jgi:hypothetical protein
LGKLEEYGGNLAESYTSGKTMYYETTMTAPTYTGKGLASTIGGLIEIESRLADRDEMFLYTPDESISYHQRHGYELTDETKIMRWENDEGVTETHVFRGMRKLLTGNVIDNALQRSMTEEDYNRYVAVRDAIRIPELSQIQQVYAYR